MPRNQGSGMIDAILLNYDRHRRIYIILFIVYVFGISVGSFWVNGMGIEQQEIAAAWYDRFAGGFLEVKPDWVEILLISLYRRFALAFIIWFLGTSIAGLPFVYSVMCVKGFVTGLSTGFLIKMKGLWGIGYSAFAILPIELIEIPILIAMSSIAIAFASTVREGRSMLKTAFWKYCLDSASLLFLLCLLSFFDALILPGIIRALLRSYA